MNECLAHNAQAVDGFATVFASKAMGTAGQVILPLLVALSAAGAANGGMFAGARVVYVSARQGDFPAFFAKLHGNVHPSPMRAIVFQGIGNL